MCRWTARLEAGDVQRWSRHGAGGDLHDQRRLWRVHSGLQTTSVIVVAGRRRAGCIVVQLRRHLGVGDRQRSWYLVSTSHH